MPDLVMFLGCLHTYIMQRVFFISVGYHRRMSELPDVSTALKTVLSSLRDTLLYSHIHACNQTHCLTHRRYRGFLIFWLWPPSMAHLRPRKVCCGVCVCVDPSESVLPNVLPISKSNSLNTHTSCPSRFPPQNRSWSLHQTSQQSHPVL